MSGYKVLRKITKNIEDFIIRKAYRRLILLIQAYYFSVGRD